MVLGKKLLLGGLVSVCLGLLVPLGIAKLNPYRNGAIVYMYKQDTELLRKIPLKNYAERRRAEDNLREMESGEELRNYNDWNLIYVKNTCQGLIFGGFGASLAGMACAASELLRRKK